jgi:hypothetical protein
LLTALTIKAVSPDDGGSEHARNFVQLLPDHTAQSPGRQTAFEKQMCLQCLKLPRPDTRKNVLTRDVIKMAAARNFCDSVFVISIAAETGRPLGHNIWSEAI